MEQRGEGMELDINELFGKVFTVTVPVANATAADAADVELQRHLAQPDQPALASHHIAASAQQRRRALHADEAEFQAPSKIRRSS